MADQMMNPEGQPTPQGRMTTPQGGGDPAPTGGPTAGGSPTPMPQEGTPTPPMGATGPMSTTPGQVQAAQSRMGATGPTMGSALGLTKGRVPGMGAAPSGIPQLPPNVFTNSDVLKEAKKDLGSSRRFKDFEFMLKKYSKKKR